MEKRESPTIADTSVNLEFPTCRTRLPGEALRVFIAWTTVADRFAADVIAADVIARDLAVCVQIEGPITSLYRWHGKPEEAQEFRLTFKCLPERVRQLGEQVLATHPYDTPEWVVVKAEHVGEKYLSWANANSSNPPL